MANRGASAAGVPTRYSPLAISRSMRMTQSNLLDVDWSKIPAPTDDWDMIPGARGCTPQTCAFRDLFAELKAAGVAHVFGLSTQSNEYQTEMASRLHLPFPVLSDEKLALTRALDLPTMEVAGLTMMKRLGLIIEDPPTPHVFIPA